MKRIIASMLVIFICLSPAAAAGDVWNYNFIRDMIDGLKIRGMEASEPQRSNSISNPEDQFKALDGRVDEMSTDDNLKTINALMHRYHYSVIHIGVTDDRGVVQRNYYIIRDDGVERDYSGKVDYTVTVSEEDANRMLDMIDDGDISFKDQVAISQIITKRPFALEYLKLSMVRLAYGS